MKRVSREKLSITCPKMKRLAWFKLRLLGISVVIVTYSLTPIPLINNLITHDVSIKSLNQPLYQQMDFSSGGGGGNDVELLSKTLQVEQKLFYFDLKENPRGRYLKISEKTSATRSTIIVPFNGIVWFFDIFNYYVTCDDQDVSSKELQLDSKVFYFDIGENRRGRFLKVSEASVSRNRSAIIVPAGSTRDEGWSTFRNILEEINEASKLFVLPNQQSSEGITQELLVGLSDDVGAGFIAGNSSQSAPTASPDLNLGDRTFTFDLPPQFSDESGSFGVSKVIRADQKRFFFDLGNNNPGHYLRISEVAGSDRASIILPLSRLKQFHQMVGHFVEITKDRIEGITGASVRNVDPSQRYSWL